MSPDRASKVGARVLIDEHALHVLSFKAHYAWGRVMLRQIVEAELAFIERIKQKVAAL